MSLIHQQHQSQNVLDQSYNVIKCIWVLPDTYLNMLTRALLLTSYLRRQHFREDHADKGCQKFHTSQNPNHAEIGSWNFHENQSQNCIASLLVLLGSSTFPDQTSVSKKVWHVWSFLVPKPFLLSSCVSNSLLRLWVIPRLSIYADTLWDESYIFKLKFEALLAYFQSFAFWPAYFGDWITKASKTTFTYLQI